jgi:uncharacterized protein (DUF1697 family)
MAESAVQVALLRGINVGGKNALPMRELVGLFEEAGCSNVRTYIQSGNVLFTASARALEALAAGLEKKIFERYRLKVPLVLRSAKELVEIAREHPFGARDLGPKALHVMFLADRPTAGAIASLDPARSLPDEFRVVGREIYLCCPSGMARTKLTNDYFDRRLATTSTVRNWRTVLALVELAGK